jgi:hypothetical protein
MNGHVGTTTDGGIYANPFGGYNARNNAVSSTAAINFSTTGNNAPGGYGSGEGNCCGADQNDATGGVGGVVYIEYVGP